VNAPLEKASSDPSVYSVALIKVTMGAKFLFIGNNNRPASFVSIPDVSGIRQSRHKSKRTRTIVEPMADLHHEGFFYVIINTRRLFNYRPNRVDRLQSRLVSTLNQLFGAPRLVPANVTDFGDD
jgi:hypothetical protein